MYNHILFDEDLIFSMLDDGDFGSSHSTDPLEACCMLRANIWIHLMERQGFVYNCEYDCKDFFRASARCFEFIKKLNSREIVFDKIGNLSL